MEKKQTRYFIIKNQIDEIPSLAEKIEELAGQWDLPDKLIMNINLVMEEALSNIIFYAFCDDKSHKIRISFSLKSEVLTIRITDDGMAFDPTSQLQPDTTLPADERPIGGLGIFLISQIMDTVHYERKNDRNMLILKKEIRYEPEKRENQ